MKTLLLLLLAASFAYSVEDKSKDLQQVYLSQMHELDTYRTDTFYTSTVSTTLIAICLTLLFQELKRNSLSTANTESKCPEAVRINKASIGLKTLGALLGTTTLFRSIWNLISKTNLETRYELEIAKEKYAFDCIVKAVEDLKKEEELEEKTEL